MLAASIADELDGEDLCAFAETLVRFFTTSRQKGAIRDTATNVRPEEFRVVWGRCSGCWSGSSQAREYASAGMLVGSYSCLSWWTKRSVGDNLLARACVSGEFV
jgi:hypothetical protein